MPLKTGHCLVMAILFKAIHKTVSPGSQEPKENMEHMASEVIKCIGYAVINKEPIECFWGVGGNHRFVFNDESSLKVFNLHSIFRRQQHVLTSTVSIFCENKDCTAGKPLERFDRQPLPDYKWWEETGQLHYFSYEARRDFPRGPWDKCPGLFLPDRVLETFFRVLPSPLDDELTAVAFLPWYLKRKHCNSTLVQINNCNSREK